MAYSIETNIYLYSKFINFHQVTFSNSPNYKKKILEELIQINIKYIKYAMCASSAFSAVSALRSVVLFAGFDTLHCGFGLWGIIE